MISDWMFNDLEMSGWIFDYCDDSRLDFLILAKIIALWTFCSAHLWVGLVWALVDSAYEYLHVVCALSSLLPLVHTTHYPDSDTLPTEASLW